jgi:hypothetical protein
MVFTFAKINKKGKRDRRAEETENTSQRWLHAFFACSEAVKMRPMATVPMAIHQNRLFEQSGSSALGCW